MSFLSLTTAAAVGRIGVSGEVPVQNGAGDGAGGVGVRRPRFFAKATAQDFYGRRSDTGLSLIHI